MKAFLHAARLSESAFVLRVQERFGLLGYARWCKALELAALHSKPAAPGVVALSWSDWCAALECDGETLGEFLAFAERGKQISRDGDGRVAFLGFAELLPVEPDPEPFLFTQPAQVANYLGISLAMPKWLVEDPSNVALFRRWVAANVTREELDEAANAAAPAVAAGGGGLQPVDLHEHLMKARKRRLDDARA